MSDGYQQSLFPDDGPGSDTAPVAHARRTDRATSHEAARSVTPELTGYQQMVLRCIDHHFGTEPFADVDLVRSYKFSWERREGLNLMMQSDSGIRTRRSELTAAGLIEDTGRTRKIGKRNHTLWRKR